MMWQGNVNFWPYVFNFKPKTAYGGVAAIHIIKDQLKQQNELVKQLKKI